MSTVCAIVVTHNRKELLRECLAALDAQQRPPERVLVVDNASSDGTAAMLEQDYPAVELLALASNEGGAGGFHEGIKKAHADGAEWLWLMDDDTLPEPGALVELLAAPARVAPEPEPTVLASKVVWSNGRLHPMNAPSLDRRQAELAIHAAEHGLVPLRFATFVSLLVHRGAVDRHGLPLKAFFIWSDDIEYTSRALARGERGYLVPTSVALHKTETPHTAASAPPDRFYYHVRNMLWIVRRPRGRWTGELGRLWALAGSIVGYLRRNPRPAHARAVLRGLRDGLRPGPGPEPRHLSSTPPN